MSLITIPARLQKQAAARADHPAYAEKQNGTWTPVSFGVYGQQVCQVAKSLIALGFEAGQRICIIGPNRPEWVLADVGCMTAGGVPAGIYQTCSPEEVAYILNHAEAPIVVVENQLQWEKILVERDNLSQLRHVVMMRGAAEVSDSMVLSWDEFLAKGNDVDDAVVQERLSGLKLDDPATFIYTSGTTGPPKAVMLSHRNLAWTADSALELVDLLQDDCVVSYLPLSHIAEQMFSIHGPITAGSTVYFVESKEKLPENLKEVQPTVVFGVPRVWEKFYAGVRTKLGLATGAKAKLVKWAMKVGKAASAARNAGQAMGPSLSIQYAIANKLIFSKLAPALGLGRAKVCVSGAAPISQEILEFFACLDIVIHEVYGQSEDSGPTSFNIPGNTKFGTVGPAVPGVEIKIAEDSEILVRGPNVFLGYFKDPDATAECLQDGWLHSGDLGSLDSDGFLSITGRKKDIIITAGGKNIAPKNIEAALGDLELVSQAVVIGDRRKYLSALVTLDVDAAARFSQENNVGIDVLHENAGLISAVQAGVDKVNARFARVEHIRKFTVVPREFSIDEGELTPTLKIKRRIVNDNWSSAIEAMYTE